jgi:hypothetical protein
MHSTCVTPSHGSIKSSTSPIPIALWRLRTSRKLQSTTRSTIRRHHGTTLAFILNGTGKRLQRRCDARALVAQKRGTKLVRDRDLEWRWETKLLSSERWYRRFYKRLSLFSVAGTSNSVGPSHCLVGPTRFASIAESSLRTLGLILDSSFGRRSWTLRSL